MAGESGYGGKGVGRMGSAMCWDGAMTCGGIIAAKFMIEDGHCHPLETQCGCSLARLFQSLHVWLAIGEW